MFMRVVFSSLLIITSWFGYAFEQPVSYKVEIDEGCWRIGGMIHFEEQSSDETIGILEINTITRATLQDLFDIKMDSCANNAKALIKKENDNTIITHYESKSKPGIGEEMHATLLYTSKRFGDEYETLHDIYQNLAEVDENLPRKQPPTLDQVANAYEKIIKPDWKLSISDVEYINIKTGAGIIAKLRFEGRDILINKNGNPISGQGLHLTLAIVDSSMLPEAEKINLVVLKLKEKLSGKMIKIGNRNGLADLEFGISGSPDRVRPSLLTGAVKR